MNQKVPFLKLGLSNRLIICILRYINIFRYLHVPSIINYIFKHIIKYYLNIINGFNKVVLRTYYINHV